MANIGKREEGKAGKCNWKNQHECEKLWLQGSEGEGCFCFIQGGKKLWYNSVQDDSLGENVQNTERIFDQVF